MGLNIKKGGGSNKLPPRFVLLGEPKVGKTTFASESGGIFIPTEDGCSQIDDLAYFEKALEWQTVLDNIRKLGTEDHDYKWLVIDTLDGCETLCRNYVIENEFGNSVSAFASYGKGFAALHAEFKVLLDYLDRVREKKNMGVILLCHTAIESVNSPVDGDYTRYIGQVHKKTWAQVQDWADQIGFARHDFAVIGANDNEGKKGKAKNRSDDRHIHFKGSAAMPTGCRAGFEMPDKIDLEFISYREALLKNYNKTKEGAK